MRIEKGLYVVMFLIYRIGSTLLVTSGIVSLLSVFISWISKGKGQTIRNIVTIIATCFSLFIIVILTQYTDVPVVIGMSNDNANQWLSSKGLNVVCINQENNQPETDLTLPVNEQSDGNCVVKKGKAITLYTRQKTSEIVDKSEGNLYANTNSQYYTPGKKYNIGDNFLFGSYEQDGISDNGKELIEWRVLSILDDKLLVISKYGLNYMKFQANDNGPTWEKSSLRQWLNSSLYETSFTPEERCFIAGTENANAANPSYFTDGGEDTTDSLFCLSVYEAIKYFDTDADRVAAPTIYAIESFIGKNLHKDGDYWWLRTPGNTEAEVMNVRGKGSNAGEAGSINFYGSHSIGDEIMVRPAMWISLKPTE